MQVQMMTHWWRRKQAISVSLVSPWTAPTRRQRSKAWKSKFSSHTPCLYCCSLATRSAFSLSLSLLDCCRCKQKVAVKILTHLYRRQHSALLLVLMNYSRTYLTWYKLLLLKSSALSCVLYTVCVCVCVYVFVHVCGCIPFHPSPPPTPNN